MTEDLTTIEKEAKEIGEQLAYMLAAADLPDDVKSAWLALIPHMELEQIDELMKALARYTVAPANEAFADTAKKLEAIQAAHATQIASAQEKANASFDEIEKLIQKDK